MNSPKSPSDSLPRRSLRGLNRRRFLAASGVAAGAGALAGAMTASDPAGAQYIPNRGDAAGRLVANPRYPSKMRVGLFTWMFNDKPLGWVLDYAQELKLGALELGAGNDPGSAHVPVDDLLADAGKRRTWLKQFTDRGLIISAFSAHGNNLHPDPAVARKVHETFVRALRLAQLMDVPIVVGFSGCPGDDRGGGRPNWVASIDNDEYVNLLKWQWAQKIIPYWKETAGIARGYGRRIALEFDPGESVYNVYSLLRLRRAAGDNVGCNLDLSNMFAQGVNAMAVIKKLGEEGALYTFHAKDAVLDQRNADVNGYIDLQPYEDVPRRSWSYAIPGYGHSPHYWREMVSTMKNVGYDYVLSIEHEDPTTEPVVGVRLAANFLHGILLQ
jgi:sugar phosphate isomerase/epimerase